MPVTKEEYDKALNLLTRVKRAERDIAEYEEEQRWISDPVTEIMEQGKVEFVAGEKIRKNDMLWRATSLRYVHEKGTVERSIVYAMDADAKNMLETSQDETKLI